MLIEILIQSIITGIIFSIILYYTSRGKIFFVPQLKNDDVNTTSRRYRGIGIFYILTLLPFFFNFRVIISLEAILLILSFSIIGFVDDKYDLKSKYKLFIFILISLLFNYFDIENKNEFLDINIQQYLGRTFLLIFLVLFFNQIDGINGLAGLTYTISILVISLFFGNIIYCLNFLSIIIIYLFFNLKGKIGIQGDSGSYFMATTFFILVLDSTSNFNPYYAIFFLCPIVFDIIATTSVRIFFKINIFKSHRNNLYQKIAFSKNNHLLSTFMFVSLQLIFSIIFIKFYKNNFYFLVIFNLIIYLIFVYISYLIHARDIFCETNEK